MKKIFITLGLLIIILGIVLFTLGSRTYDDTRLEKLKTIKADKPKPSVDHSKFQILQKKFETPSEVTLACLTCHNGRAQEVMQSNHWNWEEPVYIKGRGIVYLGKKNAINNFCLGAEGNELACAKCHVGLGMESSETFDYKDSSKIDCMVCHDNSETYAKGKEMGGAPDPSLNLNEIAQHIGKPKRTNCGVCHFYGGGGNNVKHGDLEKAMFEPNKNIDVHMAVEGMNMACIDCHETKNHNIGGRLYSLASNNLNRIYCENCHDNTPHKEDILNKHTLKVACQTCHIPVYAKVNATKTYWDWSTAAKLKDGKPYEEVDEEGNHTYLSTKGSFKWGKNLKPDYVWFNGTADHYLLGDKIEDTTKPLVLNQLYGSYSDRKSKITPVKTMITNQCFDPEYLYLTVPKLFSPRPGEGAFWQDFDCLRALDVGMKEKGLPFSGKLSFIETKMYWPVNHMVSPKEQSVKCIECHTRNDSRLKDLKDFYMPGRDYNKVVEYAGIGVIFLSFVLVIVHGSTRVISSIKSKKREIKK